MSRQSLQSLQCESQTGLVGTSGFSLPSTASRVDLEQGFVESELSIHTHAHIVLSFLLDQQ